MQQYINNDLREYNKIFFFPLEKTKPKPKLIHLKWHLFEMMQLSSYCELNKIFCFFLVGLDAAGKTTILYKLKLGEIVTTIPTIGKINSDVFITNSHLCSCCSKCVLQAWTSEECRNLLSLLLAQGWRQTEQLQGALHNLVLP